MYAYMIGTVCAEYTENAEDNNDITKNRDIFDSHVAYTCAPGLNKTDIQICLHHVLLHS